jgi:hypothetical protein
MINYCDGNWLHQIDCNYDLHRQSALQRPQRSLERGLMQLCSLGVLQPWSLQPWRMKDVHRITAEDRDLLSAGASFAVLRKKLHNLVLRFASGVQ